MAMSKHTSLVASLAEVVRLTQHQGLASLESPELDLDDALLTAHQEVYCKLEGRGIDPGKLSNADDYRRCIAWRLLANLAAVGAISVRGEDADTVHQRYALKAEQLFQDVRPQVTEGGSGQRAGVMLPKAFNVGPRYFGIRVRDDLPRIY